MLNFCNLDFCFFWFCEMVHGRSSENICEIYSETEMNLSVLSGPLSGNLFVISYPLKRKREKIILLFNSISKLFLYFTSSAHCFLEHKMSGN